MSGFILIVSQHQQDMIMAARLEQDPSHDAAVDYLQDKVFDNGQAWHPSTIGN